MGSGNPGDKPGYKFLQLTGDAAADEAAINALADQGYRVEAQMGANDMYLLLENYDMHNAAGH